jgi:large conductance mechanosensitive channel
MQSLVKEFRTFLVRGSLVDLAVGIVIGVAFGALVNALVADFITPLIAAIFGKHDFSALSFTINKSRFLYGDFINALLTFLSVAAAVFFFVVKPVNHLLDRWKTEPSVDAPTRQCPDCLSEIPKAARRCAFCTTEVAPAV